MRANERCEYGSLDAWCEAGFACAPGRLVCAPASAPVIDRFAFLSRPDGAETRFAPIEVVDFDADVEAIRVTFTTEDGTAVEVDLGDGRPEAVAYVIPPFEANDTEADRLRTTVEFSDLLPTSVRRIVAVAFDRSGAASARVERTLRAAAVAPAGGACDAFVVCEGGLGCVDGRCR